MRISDWSSDVCSSDLFAMRVIIIERRAIGVGQGDGDVGRMFLQSQPGPGERASGADRTGEAVQLPAGLRPDLRRGRADMGEAVCRVVELVGPERARRLFRDAA